MPEAQACRVGEQVQRAEGQVQRTEGQAQCTEGQVQRAEGQVRRTEGQAQCTEGQVQRPEEQVRRTEEGGGCDAVVCDALAFGPHPDDVELGCGGTLIKLRDLGYSTVLVDMTRGEMSTRGTVETRAAEAAAAARILGALARVNLGLPDGCVRSDEQARRRVVEVVRKYRPQLVFIPYYQDRHPDHYNGSELAYEGVFMAGLARYETGQPAHRPIQVLYYMRWDEFEPTFVVDISDQYERKMQAVWAYASQFKVDDATFGQTRLTTPEYHWKLEHQMAYYGSLIQKRYGEAFLARGVLEVDDPLQARFVSF